MPLTPARVWSAINAPKPRNGHREAAAAIEIMATANLFRRGHRICLEITSLDLPTGVAGATNAEYVPYHIYGSRTVVHRIYHDAKRPSHLLLPVVPTATGEQNSAGG